MPRDPFNTVQDEAALAERFRNSTSSLAQRQRYAEQRAAGEVDTTVQDAEDFEVAQLRDPALGRLMLGRQRERRMAIEGELNRDFRTEQQNFQQRRAAQQDALAKAKFGLDVEKADLAERKALREMQDAARIERETDSLEQASFDLRQAGMLPGSEGYAAGMAAAAIANPYAKPDLRKAIFADARIDHDADEFLAEAQRIGVKNPKLSVRQGADGRMVYSVSEGATPKDEAPEQKIAAAEKRLFELQDRLKSGIGPDDHALVSELATEARTALQALRGGATRQAQPASQPAEIPSVTTKEQRDALPAGSKYIRDGVTYTKQ